jgi:long-chain acyl-CoA synthetase
LTNAAAAPVVKRPDSKDEEANISPVVALLADIAGVTPAAIEPGLALGNDIGLDSLNRVELLSAIEERNGVYVDERRVTPSTTVRELEALVASGPRAADIRFPQWGMAFWCRGLRGFLQRGIVFPAMALAYKMRVTGVDNLDLQGPALVAANHTLHLDNGIILRSLPTRFRERLAIAASDHMWRSPIRSLAIPLLGNGFPFSKEGNVRKSLDNVGRIIDNGWSVLIYPEGELTVEGPMKPFLAGTGLICVGGKVPVIPLKLRVIRTGFPKYFPLLSRGEVEVCFGEPLTFGPDVTYHEATARIEEAVRAL